ncbi:hypothetical protein MKX01_013758 [Papaver californicum]|nr:hypothetical protein MKX01_013758 [Papaver californicum]
MQRKVLIHEEAHLLENNNNGGSMFMVLLSTSVAVCGSFTFGTCIGFSAPTQSEITSDLGLSLSEYSVFGSIATIGAMAMTVLAVFCSEGWLAIYFSKGVVSLDIGRLCSGGAFILYFYPYLFPPKHLRGRLATLNQLMMVTVVSFTFIIGTVVSWRTLALIGVLPCFILLFGLFLIPESPRWLAKVGQQKEFQLALRKLRGKDADISQEIEDIQDYLQTLQHLPRSQMLDLFQKRYLVSVSVGVGLMVFQQFGGINGVSFYLSHIFESADSNNRIRSNFNGSSWKKASFVSVVSFTFNFLMSWSSYGTFLLHATVNPLAILFVVKIIPETKGRTLEEIQASMN